MARESWTSEENAATVAAYLDMLEQELTGQPFVKSEINRRLVERIGRTRGGSGEEVPERLRRLA